MGFPNLGDYAQNNGVGGEEGVGLILALPHLFTSTTHFGALLFQRPKATLGQFGMAKKSAGTHTCLLKEANWQDWKPAVSI